MMSSYQEQLMRKKIEACVQKITSLTEKGRGAHIHAADKVPHHYSDKFLLADTITNTMCASLLHCLSVIGLVREDLKTLKSWVSGKTVTMSFRFTRKSTLLREQEREVESNTRVQEMSSTSGTSSISVVTKVKEYVFQEEQTQQLVAFSGVGDNATEFMTVFGRSGSAERICTYRSENYERSSHSDLDLSWLLSVLSENGTAFSIDRSRADCFTPVENCNIIEVTDFAHNLRDFARSISLTVSGWRRIQGNVGNGGKSTACEFNPVVPLFEACGELSATPVSSDVINALLHEYHSNLMQMCADAEAALPALPAGSPAPLFGPNEARLEIVMDEMVAVAHNYHMSIDFLEDMIRKQLVAAIGKTVSAQDFAQYMTFHNRKVFKEAYQPRPFSYAVRRSPAHSPEGHIQIETSNVTPSEPICTVSQHIENAPHMEFALNATTTVKFGGERHLHGWMAHRFSGQALPELKLVAEARQFSSYIVLIGRIALATLFQPKYGFIVQNKDEFRIPLDLEQIPTAKEFKDAISSLSPEQQRFAKAFRSMQLESTLFGVCVIQIKPQLEKVLKLQADSLTKEIKLTQDLMQLFTKYQIPTDLLSYQGPQELEGALGAGGCGAGLMAVKGHAQALQEVLLSAKEEEVVEAELRRGLKRGREETEGDGSDDEDAESEESEEESEDDVDYYDECEEEEEELEERYSRSMIYENMKKAARKSAPAYLYQPRRRSALPTKKFASSQPLHLSGDKVADELMDRAADAHRSLDFTAYPTKLEEMYSQYDPDSSLRPTIINPGATWIKRAQAGLLSAPQTASLNGDLQATEKRAAFDLLDALTRSGALPIEHASLHVIIAATHCFDQSLMDTVVKKNVNPIERAERSTLIMAAALNDVPASALIKNGQMDRVSEFSPMLFLPLSDELTVEEG